MTKDRNETTGETMGETINEGETLLFLRSAAEKKRAACDLVDRGVSLTEAGIDVLIEWNANIVLEIFAAVDPRVIARIVDGDHLELLNNLHERGVVFARNVCHVAIESGSCRYLKWAFRHGYKVDIDKVIEAANAGRTDLFVLCLRYMKKVSSLYFVYLVSRKNYTMLTELCKRSKKVCDLAVELAITADDPIALKILLGKKPFLLVKNCVAAGAVACLEWVLLSCTPSMEDWENAVRAGNIGVLAAMYQPTPTKRFKFERSTHLPALAPDVPTLAWLRDNGCAWDKRVIKNAVGSKNLLILDYAFQNNCPQNK